MSGPEDDPLPEAVALVEGACARGTEAPAARRARGARALPGLPAPAAAGPGHGPGLRVQGAARRRRLPGRERVRPRTRCSTRSTATGRCTSPRPSGRPVDVMVDRLVMCHTLDFRPSFGNSSLTLDPADLLLSKLQIFELNAKDARDITHLLSGVPVGAKAGGAGGGDRSSTPAASARCWRRTGAGGAPRQGTWRSCPRCSRRARRWSRRRRRFDPLEQAARLLEWPSRCRSR